MQEESENLRESTIQIESKRQYPFVELVDITVTNAEEDTCEGESVARSFFLMDGFRVRTEGFPNLKDSWVEDRGYGQGIQARNTDEKYRWGVPTRKTEEEHGREETWPFCIREGVFEVFGTFWKSLGKCGADFSGQTMFEAFGIMHFNWIEYESTYESSCRSVRWGVSAVSTPGIFGWSVF
jgi:hypothetical protein